MVSDSDSDDGDQKRKRRELSEAEIIKRKRETRKRKKEKLLEKLEKRKKREEEAAKSLDRNRAASKHTQEGSSVSKGRSYSVSVALPGSILDNAQSPELRSYLAGQIARALAVYNVDEVVVFDDEGKSGGGQGETTTEGEFSGVGKHGKGCLQLARILQYLECPQYLRKHFFPIHQDLKYAGILNPTDMPHHLRASEDSAYREGVVLDRPPAKRGSIVSVGRNKDVVIDKRLSPGIRVTVELEQDPFTTSSKLADGKVVAPDVPRKEAGLYWGYTVRLAENLSSVFAKSPYPGGYDHTIGTSERGTSVDESSLKPGFSHLLIVFGGVKGLEAALEVDPVLEGDDPEPLFDLYLNTCPGQGSRTIRTEEAVLVTLSVLRPKIFEASMNPGSTVPKDEFLLAHKRTPNGDRSVALTKSWTLLHFLNGKMTKKKPLLEGDAKSAAIFFLTARNGKLYTVLHIDDRVLFYDTESLDLTREFASVKGLSVGDFWNCGSDQARMTIADGSEVVTDLGPAPSAGKPDAETVDGTCAALSKQLTMAKMAVSDALSDVAAIDNLIDSFCSEISSDSRPSMTDDKLVTNVMGARVAVVPHVKASFVPDLDLEWNPGTDVRMFGKNLVISLMVTNISPLDIVNISICPTTRARRFVYSVEKEIIQPNCSASIDIHLSLREMSTNMSPLDGFQVGGLITYGEEGARKHQAIPDTEVKVCDLVDHDNITKEADIEAMKSFYGTSKISFRRFDGTAVSIKDLSDCLMSLGFSTFSCLETLVHDKPSSLLGKVVAVVSKNELSMFGDPDRLKILVALIQKSLSNVAIIQAPESVKRRMSKYADKKSALIDELNFINEFAVELLPTPSTVGLTFEEKQKMFHESNKSVKVSAEKFCEFRRKLAGLERRSDEEMIQ